MDVSPELPSYLPNVSKRPNRFWRVAPSPLWFDGTFLVCVTIATAAPSRYIGPYPAMPTPELGMTGPASLSFLTNQPEWMFQKTTIPKTLSLSHRFITWRRSFFRILIFRLEPSR